MTKMAGQKKSLQASLPKSNPSLTIRINTRSKGKWRMKESLVIDFKISITRNTKSTSFTSWDLKYKTWCSLQTPSRECLLTIKNISSTSRHNQRTKMLMQTSTNQNLNLNTWLRCRQATSTSREGTLTTLVALRKVSSSERKGDLLRSTWSRAFKSMRPFPRNQWCSTTCSTKEISVEKRHRS